MIIHRLGQNTTDEISGWRGERIQRKDHTSGRLGTPYLLSLDL
jgi:hypothetical protein